MEEILKIWTEINKAENRCRPEKNQERQDSETKLAFWKHLIKSMNFWEKGSWKEKEKQETSIRNGREDVTTHLPDVKKKVEITTYFLAIFSSLF